MKYKQCILVGVDYSPCSENALREAARIASWNDTPLCCFHIVDEEVFECLRDVEGFDEQAILDSATERLKTHVREVIGSEHEFRAWVKIGHPFEELLKAVEGSGSNLLVMGSHGLSENTPGRTGAFASRCVRKAPLDVLLVRGRQVTPFSTVVACVDFSENSIRGAYRAAEISAQDGAALELLHIYRSPISAASDIGGFGPVLPPSDSARVIANLRKRLLRIAKEIGDECGIEVQVTVIERTGIAHEIVKHLIENGADFAVLGTRGRTGFRRLLLGTTAEHVIHDSPCSTLAVKPHGFEYSL